MNRRDRTKRLKANIPLHITFLGFTNVNLVQGLWMIFLALCGHSLLELGILEGVFHLTSFLMEIPTGMIADIWGRKVSRLAGRVCFIISLLLKFYGAGVHFGFLLVSFIFSALSYNLESGAGEAFVYDTLKEQGRSSRFSRLAGWQNVAWEGGGVISFLLGGAAATWLGYEWVFLPTIALSAAAFITGLFWIEPYGDTASAAEVKSLREMHWFSGMGEQFRRSFRVMRNAPRVAFLILFSEILMTFWSCFYFFLQTFWKSAGWTEFSVQGALAATSALSALAGLAAGRWESRLNPRRLFPAIASLSLLFFWLIALFPMQPVFFVALGVLDGLLYVCVASWVNEAIPSAQRATVLSVQSMAFSFFMILLFPLTGFLAERFSTVTAFIAISGVAAALYVPFLIVFLFARPSREGRKQA